MTDHQGTDFSACRLLSESHSGPADVLPTDCRVQTKSGCDSADSGCDFDTELSTAVPDIWKVNREAGSKVCLDGTTSASSPPSASHSTYTFSSCSSEEKSFCKPNGVGAFDTSNLLEPSADSSKVPLLSSLSNMAASETPSSGNPHVPRLQFFPPAEHQRPSNQSDSGEPLRGTTFANTLQDSYDGEMSFITAGLTDFHRPRDARFDQNSAAAASVRRATARTQRRGAKQAMGKMKIPHASPKENESTAIMKSPAAPDVQSPGASYKYLSWREKDRRRRFREEWKNLWLVIPYGSYEVMCLLCHKIMTQRKLDTIKRHTIRRHTELLSMSELERQRLYYELTTHRLHRLGDKPGREGLPTEECGEANALPFGGHFSPLAPMLRTPMMGPKLGSHCRQACGSRTRLSLTGSRPSIQKARSFCQGARGRSTRIGHRTAGAPKVIPAACQFSPRDPSGLSAFPCAPDAHLIAQQKIPLADEIRLKEQPPDNQSHSGMQLQGTASFESKTDVQTAPFPSRADITRQHQPRALIQPPISSENPSMVGVRNVHIQTSSTACEAQTHPAKVSDKEPLTTVPRPTAKFSNTSGLQPGTEVGRKPPFLSFIENAFLRRSLARELEGIETRLPTGIPSLNTFSPCSPDMAVVMKCFMDLQKGLSAKPSSTYQPKPTASSYFRPNNHKREIELPFVHHATKAPPSRFCSMTAPTVAVSNAAPSGRYTGRLPASTSKLRRDQTPTPDSLLTELQAYGLLRPTKTPLTQVMNSNRSCPYWEREELLERTKPTSRATFAGNGSSGCCRVQAGTASGVDPRSFFPPEHSLESHPRTDMVFEPGRAVGRIHSHKHLPECTTAQPPTALDRPLNLNQSPNKNPLYLPPFGHPTENTSLRSQFVSPTCIARLLQSMAGGQTPLLATSHALNRPPASTETPREDSSCGDGGARNNTEGNSLTERLNRLVTAWDIAAVDGRQKRL